MHLYNLASLPNMNSPATFRAAHMRPGNSVHYPGFPLCSAALPAHHCLLKTVPLGAAEMEQRGARPYAGPEFSS